MGFDLDSVVFGITFVVALGTSMAMLFARNAVHAALFLVAAQVALAVTFLMQGAFFIAAIQIIVYAGAIMVLFLFVIMLLGVDRREALVEPLRFQRPLAIGLGALLAAEILYVAARGLEFAVQGSRQGDEAIADLNSDPGNVESIAGLLFGDYLLPFEITSVLLVVAIVGVMVLARRIRALPAERMVDAPDDEEAA
ncbi:MAG: NADH-quinone oxidoreductase subunit J family protein [Actinomycetota bacterium]